jgi:hypothetical protein
MAGRVAVPLASAFAKCSRHPTRGVATSPSRVSLARGPRSWASARSMSLSLDTRSRPCPGHARPKILPIVRPVPQPVALTAATRVHRVRRQRLGRVRGLPHAQPDQDTGTRRRTARPNRLPTLLVTVPARNDIYEAGDPRRRGPTSRRHPLRRATSIDDAFLAARPATTRQHAAPRIVGGGEARVVTGVAR